MESQDFAAVMDQLSSRLARLEKQFNSQIDDSKETDLEAEKVKEIFEKGKHAFVYKKKHLRDEFETLHDIAKLIASDKPENKRKILDIIHKRASTLLVAANDGWDAASMCEFAYPKPFTLESDPELAKEMNQSINNGAQEDIIRS